MSHPLWLVFLVWVLGFGSISIFARNRITRFLLNSKSPFIISYFVLIIPIVLIEKSLTIEVPYFWGIIPMVIIFSIYFLLLLIIQKIFHFGFILMVVISGFLGWINEFLLVGRIHQMSGLVLVIMSVLCWLIYAVMEILPATLVQNADNR